MMMIKVDMISTMMYVGIYLLRMYVYILLVRRVNRLN